MENKRPQRLIDRWAEDSSPITIISQPDEPEATPEPKKDDE